MLTSEEKSEFLKAGIFGRLNEETRLEVAERMGQRELADGEALFLNGEPGEEVFIVVSGSIEIHIQEHVIAALEKGEVFGEMAVFGRGRRTASARARGETILLFLKNKAARLLIQQDPDVAFGFFGVLSDRLEQANLVARFLSAPAFEYGMVEVVSGELAGKVFPMNHENTCLGRTRGGVADVLRISLPVESEDLLERHAAVGVRNGCVFVSPQDGEVKVNGETIDDEIEVSPEDTVEAGGLGLRFKINPGLE